MPLVFNLDESESSLFVPIDLMSETIATSTSAAAAPPQTNSVPPHPPQAGGASDAEGLLKQADMLKEQQMEAAKQLEKEKSEKSAMQKELEFYRAKAAAEAEEYKKQQEPKFNEYIEQLQITAGKKLPESKIAQYRTLFTVPQFKEDADAMYAQHKQTVELKASAKKFEEELAKERAEKAQLTATLSKASQQVGGMRKSYADALSAERIEEPVRKEVGVTASLNANEIMAAMPSVADLPFLQKYGFSNEVGVNASAAGGGGAKLIRTSVQAAREHRLLLDEDGDLQFPASARYHNPTVFAWMVNEAPLNTMDLSDHVAINASRTFVEEKRVD